MVKRKLTRKPRCPDLKHDMEILLGARVFDEPYHDPFEIIGPIPNGMTYQWCPLSLLGESQPVENILNRMKAGGWNAVPSRRHPQMTHQGGKIVFGGQVLMQRPKKTTSAAQNREIAKAHRQLKEHPTHGDRQHFVVPITGAPPVEQAAQADIDIEKAKSELRTASGVCFVDITIAIAISDREIETAIRTLQLTPAEYMRRRIIMDTRALIRRGDSLAIIDPASERHEYPIFQRAEIKAHVLET